MGNYKQKLKGMGWRELEVNSEKRGAGDTQGKRNKVKKPRRSETNFLPDLPQGRDSKSFEEDGPGDDVASTCVLKLWGLTDSISNAGTHYRLWCMLQPAVLYTSHQMEIVV
ncbi:hypothetical protein PAMP_003504 [Pampus punctatissimus]